MRRQSLLKELFRPSRRRRHRRDAGPFSKACAAIERLEDRTLLAVTTIFDEAAFLSQTGAEPRVTLPDEIWSAGSSYTENGVTIQHANNDDIRIGERTPLYDGNELALDGMENLNVLFDAPAMAYGVRMQDGHSVGWIGASGQNSVFTITVKSNGQALDQFTIDPPVDEQFFLGIVSDDPFDRVEIRETQGGIENDFFNQMFVAAAPVDPVCVNHTDDQASFLGETGAEARVTLPDEIWSAGTSYTENGVTIQHANNDDVRIGERTPLYDGNELALDGMENINVLFDEPVTAFGVEMQDGFQVGWIGASGADSVFEVTVKSGSETLDSFTVDPPVDERYFIGITSTKPFDRVEIREIQGGIENDFFHHFFATSTFTAECQTPEVTVGTTADSGVGSLRWAIEQANANPGEDRIVFNIPETDLGFRDIDGDGIGDVFVIQLQSALPALTDGATIIDGRTQTAFTGDTNPLGPEIVIDGNDSVFHGLQIKSSHNQISGLTIQRVDRTISISGGHENHIFGNFIGTNAAGTAAIGSSSAIRVDNGASGNIFGTNGDGVSDAAEGNVIWPGIVLDTNAHDNTLAGNLIGTDASGESRLGQSGSVRIQGGAADNWIGTNGDGISDDLEGNVIAGGITIVGPDVAGNVVAGNHVGVDMYGTSALGNGGGVSISDGAHDNRIGTDGDGVGDSSEGNVVYSHGTGVGINRSAYNNIVAGNLIGVDATGSTALGFSFHGISIGGGAHNNLVGTDGDGSSDELERNVIVGDFQGIVIGGDGTDDNVIAGNYIGTDATGTIELKPDVGNVGILVQQGAQGTIIGTDGDGSHGDANEGNLISGNGGNGVRIVGTGTNGHVVAGNWIGLDANGDALGNFVGVHIGSGAQHNRIGTDGDGTSDQAERNVISANRGRGVQIVGHHNYVAGNFIGTDTTGTAARPNGANGVQVFGQHNIIGTDGDGLNDAVEGNVISGNADVGVGIDGPNAQHNVVAGNLIGVDAGGTRPLGNAGRGISLNNSSSFNIIGTNGDGVSDELEGNVISANGFDATHNPNGIFVNRGWADGPVQNVIAGNLIGTDATGTIDLGNASHGLQIIGGIDNRIGTNGDGVSDLNERNIISGNQGHGILIRAASESTVIAGNLIGIAGDGSTPLENRLNGVTIIQASFSNRIGTNGDGVQDAIERNVISGNGVHGVFITGAGTRENQVSGNYIGVDASGTVAVGNGNAGVAISGEAHTNLVGSDLDGMGDGNEGNILSGNRLYGVTILGVGTDNNQVAGNLIGTDASGTVALGNGHGVRIRSGAASNIVGGSVPEARNVISGNHNHGVVVKDDGTDENWIAGNLIGTDTSGSVALGNGGIGVFVLDGAQQTRIGIDSDGPRDVSERNVISGNAVHGVAIIGTGTDSNRVAGNFIGTDVTGSESLANGTLSWHAGVLIQGGAAQNIAGTDGDGNGDAAEGNVISGNAGVGVSVAFNSDDNKIAGNLIGTDADGLQALGNAVGVNIQSGSTGNLLTRNVISGQTQHGVGVWSAVANEVRENFIGTDITGTAPLPNSLHGMQIGGGAQGNLIEQNVISANTTDGIVLRDPDTQDNLLAGNLIGTALDGATPLGNGRHGVWLFLDANHNQIGGSPDGGNTIAFNGEFGVLVSGGDSTGNPIRVNSIHSNGSLGIDLGGGGVTPNDPGDADSGPNQLQNFPVLTAALPGAQTQVSGSLQSTPDATFTLDFYANTVPDPSGHGEGERWLGSVVVTTDADGNADFQETLAGATVRGEFVSATATDANGNTSEFSSNVIVNTPPVADAGGPYEIDEGDSLTLNATGSFDPDGDPVTFRWDVDGDGDFDEDIVGATTTLTWSQLSALGIDDGPDSRTVTVEASDGHDVDIDATALTVHNVAPEIDAGSVVVSAPQEDKAKPGEAITVSASFIDPGLLDTHTVIIDWDDGSKSNSSLNPGDFPALDVSGGGPGSFTATHTYSTGGIFTVGITVIDDDGGVSETVATEVWVTGVRLADNGELQVVGTSGKDIVVVKQTAVGGTDGGSDGGSDRRPDASRIQVIANFNVGRGSSDGNHDRGAHIFQFDADDVSSIRVALCEGDDHANVGASGSDGGADLLVPTLIEGGPGDDHLIGGGGRDTILGGAGNDHLRGRGGDDVLVGGDGHDRLHGGDGRNVLIGGLGRDRLWGGGDDHLLIAGRTSHDKDLLALNRIYQEWTSAADYLDRVDHLRHGTGPHLDGVTLQAGVTVFDDGARDTLRGKRGHDWFFASLDDRLQDRRPNEQWDVL